MSKTIDERVVEMRFDNKQFESNVKTSMSTLERLKLSLNFSGASKGLSCISESARSVDLSPIGRGVEAIQAKFSAMQVIAFTALTNITNSAMNAGKRMISALTIDPVKTGFKEYETQIGAIQTILANTQSKGSTLQDVNKALAELNTYADKTIYNFTEMTRNIGTFTAAGVDLDKAVTSIKGIANLAAVSGSTSQQASTAMYQLSQALAAGRVNLMDWNSVVNAGMGGELFQNALKRTATHMGKNVDEIIAKYGSFRESLTQGEWLTTEVLTETLTQLSGAYSEADLIAQGYTESQAKEIAKLAETAVNAATKVKTFTQLWDTLKEAAQSGWTQSWQAIIGDFDEAQDLLTSISEKVGGMINSSAESRNKLLTEGLSTGWKQFISKGINDEELFRDTVKIVAKDHGIAVDEMIEKNGSFEKSLKEGWMTGDILAESLDKVTKKVEGMSAEQLKEAGYTDEQVKKLKELNEAVKNGTINVDEFAKKMNQQSGRENIIEGLKNVFTSLLDVIKPIKEAFSDIFPAMTGEQLYAITEKFKALTENLKVSDEVADKIKRTFKGLFSIFDMVAKVATSFAKAIGSLFTGGGVSGVLDLILTITASIGDFFTNLNKGFDTSSLTKFLTSIGSAFSEAVATITEKLSGLGDFLSRIGKVIGDFALKVWDGLGKAFKWISENISGGDILAGLTGGGIFVALKKLAGLFSTFKEVLENLPFIGTGGKDSKEATAGFRDILDSVHESIQSFTSGIKAGSLLMIAGAIGILSSSLKSISEIKADDIAKSLVAIKLMFMMLNKSFNELIDSINMWGNAKGVIKGATSMVLIAFALRELSKSLVDLSKLSWEEIAKGLVAVGGGLIALVAGLKAIEKIDGSMKSAFSLVIIAKACQMIAEPLAELGNLSWEQIGKGLVAMGGALAELVVAVSVLNRFAGFESILGSTAILIAVQSLDEIAKALAEIGKLSWDQIAKGLTGMGAALAEVATAAGVLGKLAGFSGIVGGGAIVLTVQALDEIADAIEKIGGKSWDAIAKGLTGMGVALAEVATAAGALGKLAGLSGIIGGGVIVLTVQALDEISTAIEKIGGKSWDAIAKGLTGMGVALAEVATAAGALGKLAGLWGIVGGGAIVLTVQALDEISAAIESIGGKPWETINQGLVGMGYALAEVSIAAGALGTIAGFSGIFGAGAIWISVQGLGDLADAMQKFGSMSWEEIGHGLVAMGAALGELAAIFTIVSSIALETAIGGASMLPGISGLKDLAEAMQEFASMSWDEIDRGLTAMGAALGEVALGSLANTLSIFGSLSISTIAKPLKDLANAVREWADVTVPPGLSDQLSALGTAIRAYGTTYFSGWSIEAVAEPLGELAKSVKKWENVVIPADLSDNLEKLGTAVSKFGLSGIFAGWSIDNVAKPLGELAKSVMKWKDVTVPPNIGDDLEKLSKGVKKFEGVGDVSLATSAFSTITGCIKKVADVDFTKVADGLNNVGASFGSFATSAKGLAGVGNSITQNITNPLKKVSGQFTSAGSGIADALSKGISASSGSITGVIDGMLNTAVAAVRGKSGSFQSAGKSLSSSLSSGMKSGSSAIKTSMDSSVSSAASSARSQYSGFFSAGMYLASGFALGITSGSFAASIAAQAMANAAKEAAKKALDINSPSKVFRKIGTSVPEGFAQGIGRLGNLVSGSAMRMADTALDSAKKALTRISDVINMDIDAQPTIRPVVDLSNVESGADVINGMLALDPTVGMSSNLNAINASMNRRIQNGGNDDVISAINSLKNTIADSSGDTYNVNGVTYDDGSNVAGAVKALVRAAKIERRS